ncbi:LCP family protein [Bacillus sp. AK031]
MSTDRRHFQLRRKKKRRRRILFFLVIPFLLIALSAAGYGAYLYKKAENAVNDSYNDLDGREKSDKRQQEVNPEDDNVSILFIGVDESDSRNFGEAVRSDALMLATLNEKNKTVKLVSIPRDSYVYVDEVGYKTKINHAYAYGGAKASMETVEELLDIPVDYYVKMNFYAFIDVVNALNGITVDVPFELYEQDSEDNKNAIHLLPGEQQLNGEEALAFARTRKMDNDIERGKRQQDILKAIMKKASQANSITKYDNVIEAVGDNMETNMTFSEMKTLGSYGINKDLNVDTLTLDGSDSYIDEIYYWQLDPTSVDSISSQLKNHLEVSSRNDKDPIASSHQP